MISIENFRKLQPEFADMPDEELEQIRAEFYALGELLFDMWKSERDSKTSHLVVGPEQV